MSRHYIRFNVEAVVLEDGTTNWGYEVPEEGDYPPVVAGAGELAAGEEIDVLADGPLDLFLQNLVRADIQGRLAVFE